MDSKFCQSSLTRAIEKNDLTESTSYPIFYIFEQGIYSIDILKIFLEEDLQISYIYIYSIYIESMFFELGNITKRTFINP